MTLRIAALALITLSAPAQQQPSTRVIHVAVTDPANRFVTGLDRFHFIVRENGVTRPVVSITRPDDSIAVVVVSEDIPPVSSSARGKGELSFARSVAEALRTLSASRATRKALIITNGDGTAEISGDVFVQRVAREVTQKAIIEARSRYAVTFASGDAAATPVVELNPPTSLPPLKPIL